MLENPRKKKRPLNRYLVLTSIPFQIGVTVYLGAYLGKHLDFKYNLEKNWFTILLVLLAIIISMYSLMKQLKKFNNE